MNSKLTDILRAIVRIAALIILAAVSKGIFAQPETSVSNEAWRADLRTLEKQITERHVNPFHKISKMEFTKAVNKLEKDIPNLTQPEILVRFAQLTAMIGDGHTSFFPSDQKGKEFRGYPVRFWHFDDGIYVIAAKEQYSDLIGKRLTQIDGTPIKKAFKIVSTAVAADNDMEFIYTVPFELRRPELLHVLRIAKRADKANFIFADGTSRVLPAMSRDESKKFEWRSANSLFGGKEPPSMTVDALFATELSAPHLINREYYWFTYLEKERSVYFQYNVCWDMPENRPSFADTAKQLLEFIDKNTVERVIIDVRQNSGGEPLTAKPLIDGLAAMRDLGREGRLFVITGRRTYSAALTNAAELRSRAGARVVGEPSRGKPNNPSEGRDILLLRSMTVASVSTQFVERDPDLSDSAYLPVDIPAVYTFEDHKSAHDAVLKAALEAVIKHKNK